MIKIEDMGRYENANSNQYLIFKTAGEDVLYSYGQGGFEPDQTTLITESEFNEKLAYIKSQGWYKAIDGDLLSEGKSEATSNFMDWITL